MEAPDAPSTSPLLESNPDFLSYIFAPSTDPTTLDDAAIARMTTEVRRRRSEFAAKEAAEQAAGKAKRAKAPPTSTQSAAALDRPVSEIGLADLMRSDTPT